MIEATTKSHDEIFNILFNKDEITWQSMIYELVSSEKMDPWNIDVSLLSKRFLERLKEYKEMDLKISGKVLLAAAILLRVKSYRFIEEDVNALDALIASVNAPQEEEFFDELLEYEEYDTHEVEEKPEIFPRTPQPRKRKVSVFDLVNALEQALEVYQRRPKKIDKRPEVKVPEKKRDISLVIKDVYKKIMDFFDTTKKQSKELTFNILLPKETKEDKVFTFIPLLHLDNQRRIDLLQKNHFGEIKIDLLKKTNKI